MPVYPLHGEQQQRARLKNLDKLKNEENIILVTTDVAARGLDIPSVNHVIHYQIPRNHDTYVHRAGRTGRAQKKGLSLLIVSPEEMSDFQNLSKSKVIPNFPKDQSIMKDVKERVNLAIKIDSLQHKMAKKNNRNWFDRMAEAADIIVDTEM